MTSRKGTILYEGRITADCHIHTEFSSDSETKITDQVERAIALGLDHICFTDHMDMDLSGGRIRTGYGCLCKTGTGATGRIQRPVRICLGVELGMQEHLKERQQAYIEKYPFDFVIGSMHLIHGEDPYFGKIYEEMGDEEAYREYFRATLENLKRAPKIHTLGHLDYAVRYGKEKDRYYSYERFSQETMRSCSI